MLALPPARPRRLAYLGTPELAVAPLEALVAAGFDVALVVTRADKRRSRGSGLDPSPVKVAAQRLGLPVSHRVDAVCELDDTVDLGVVVAFGLLIRRPVLELVPMVNLHFSLLPRWRGAAPVERALLAGDQETGVCLMALEEGLDTGPVYACERVPITPTATLADLRTDLVGRGTHLLIDALRDGLPSPAPQQGEPVYAAKIEPAELRLDLTRSATELHRVVRLGGAWTTFRGRRLKIVAAAVCPDGPPPGRLSGLVLGTGDGGLELQLVQPEGKAVQPAAAWRNGARPQPDEPFGA